MDENASPEDPTTITTLYNVHVDENACPEDPTTIHYVMYCTPTVTITHSDMWIRYACPEDPVPVECTRG